MIRVCICFLVWFLGAESVLAENSELTRDGAWRTEVAETIIERISTEYVDIIPKLENALDREVYINDIKQRALPDADFEMAEIFTDLGLDPLTQYISPETFTALMQAHETEQGATGIEFHADDQQIVINHIFADSPAARVGLKLQDRVLSVDGIALSRKSISDIKLMLSGKIGSQVKLGIQRQKSEVFEVELERTIVEIEAIQSTSVEDYIHLSRINLNDHDLTTELVKALNRQPQNCEKCPIGLILDLRNNSGGLLDLSIDFADFFIGKVDILTLKARMPKDNRVFAGDKEQWREQLPIAILVDERTASGAEMIAAAIKANRNAVTIGQPTLGAKSVQTLIPLGSERGALVLTTNNMRFAGEDTFSDLGIMPDIIASDEQALKEAIFWLDEQTK